MDEMASGRRRTEALAEAGGDSRFLLWVDAVGGYLVCLSDRVVLGQPSASSSADIPILADLSRQHAVIRRDAEGYVLEPLHTVRVGGKTASHVVSLMDGQVIELGENVRVRFRKPHALSGTARLEMLSHHRTVPSVDAVLLMAESCVLGPARHNHVVCRHWSRDLVFFRHGMRLQCRLDGSFRVDGHTCESLGQLSWGSQIEGEDFSLSLEPFDAKNVGS
jgi:hypothetical protein